MRSDRLAFALVAGALSALCLPQSQAATRVSPPWDAAAITNRSGQACVAQAANNTRLAFWALPPTDDGRPQGGWPVVVQFSAMRRAYNASRNASNTCGPRTPPPPEDLVCEQFLNATVSGADRKRGTGLAAWQCADTAAWCGLV